MAEEEHIVAAPVAADAAFAEQVFVLPGFFPADFAQEAEQQVAAPADDIVALAAACIVEVVCDAGEVQQKNYSLEGDCEAKLNLSLSLRFCSRDRSVFSLLLFWDPYLVGVGM